MEDSKFHLLRPLQARRRAAFTLVEVSIALGIVGFAMVGIMGALPLAMNSGRQSIEQSRAASLASTIFARFRAQPFAKVHYVDGAFVDPDAGTTPADDGPTLDLGSFTGSKSVTYYAKIIDPAYIDPTGKNANDPRMLSFQEAQPANGGYKIVLRFDYKPDGMLKVGMSNRVEVNINALGSPKDVYRFTSVIANRQG